MNFIIALGDIVMRLLFILVAVVFTVNSVRKLKEGSNSVHYSKTVTIISLILGDAILLYFIVTGFKNVGSHIGRLHWSFFI